MLWRISRHCDRSQSHLGIHARQQGFVAIRQVDFNPHCASGGVKRARDACDRAIDDTFRGFVQLNRCGPSWTNVNGARLWYIGEYPHCIELLDREERDGTCAGSRLDKISRVNEPSGHHPGEWCHDPGILEQCLKSLRLGFGCLKISLSRRDFSFSRLGVRL